jgi:hypothetical protein
MDAVEYFAACGHGARIKMFHAVSAMHAMVLSMLQAMHKGYGCGNQETVAEWPALGPLTCRYGQTSQAQTAHMNFSLWPRWVGE